MNDYQYTELINDTFTIKDLSDIQLYLGGLPKTNSIISALYPSLTDINSFRGCIRNVFSNGYYLDIRKSITATNSDYGLCPCTLTNACIGSTAAMHTVGFIRLGFMDMLIGLVLVINYI